MNPRRPTSRLLLNPSPDSCPIAIPRLQRIISFRSKLDSPCEAAETYRFGADGQCCGFRHLMPHPEFQRRVLGLLRAVHVFGDDRSAVRPHLSRWHGARFPFVIVLAAAAGGVDPG